MRLERAEYEAALAERRYLEVDPSQRLVASTLERRWNDALLQLEDLKKQAAEFQRQEARVATPEQKAKVLALAQRFAAVVACANHAGQGPQADVAAAHQGYYRRETLRSQAALGSHPLAGRRLHRPHCAAPAQHSRSRAVSFRSGRPRPGSGPRLCPTRRSRRNSIAKDS